MRLLRSTSSRWPGCLTATALIIGLAAIPVWGAPGDRTTRLISPGGVGAFDADFQGASSDGSRVWFATAEPNPGLGDTDAKNDVYERDATGALRLISTSGPGAFDATFADASRDGSRVWFETAEPNAGLGDTDVFIDVYERSANGTLRLISTPGTGAFDASFAGASSDGSRVRFTTDEPNLGLGDTDASFDVYERDAGGILRLISTSGPGAFDALFNGASVDGSRVWFQSTEPNLGLGDNDTDSDVFERNAAGTLRLISTSGPGAFDATFEGASGDGSRVWFSTLESNAGLADTDSRTDVYERDSAGALRLISTPGTDPSNSSFEGASSDGSRVWFKTLEENPALGDTDAKNTDIYERAANGALRLISIPGSGAFNANFEGASRDGSRVWFATVEPNPNLGDTDASFDVYERDANGALLLVTPPGAGAFDAFLAGASSDGSRRWFTTAEPNPGLGDTDAKMDTYERDATGALRLITTPGPGAFDGRFDGANEDGSRIWFQTLEPSPGLGDTDAKDDVFETRWGVPGNTSAPVVSTTGQVARLTLSCAPGIWVGDAFTVTVEWLRNGTPIAGQTGRTYVVPNGEEGIPTSCRETATNTTGAASATSNAISLSSSGPATPSTRIRLLRRAGITGPSVIGSRLGCDRTGIAGATAFSIDWRRNGKATRNTGATYLVGRKDLGKRISCAVTASNPVSSLNSVSKGRLIPVTCTVPVLRGTPLSAARTRAGLAGCRTRVKRIAAVGVPRGSVVSITPAPRAKRPNGATLTLVVRR
jgi:hypothetical protein